MALKSSSKREGFEYQKRTRADVEERANQSGGNFDKYIKEKYKVYKPREGKNVVRFLPPTWAEARHFGFNAYVNFGIGVDNQSYLSLSKMKGEPDPIDDARAEAEAEGDTKLAKSLKPKQRVVYWVIDRLAEDEGPQVWPGPWTFDRDLTNLLIDDESREPIYLDSPDEGMDFLFYKQGTGRNTEYPPAKMRVRKPSPISDNPDLQDEWLRFIKDNPLNKVFQYFPYDHIKKVYGGKAAAEGDDDGDEKPARRPARAARKDDDEDDRPARKPARTASRDEDEDEDEPPAKKRRAVSEDEDEEVVDDKPPKRRASRPAEDEDEPAPRRKPARAEPEDEPDVDAAEADPDEDEPPAKKPARRAAREEPEDEDEPPAKSKKPARRAEPEDDDEDEPPAKKPARRADPEDEDEPPAKKPRAKVQDDAEAEDEPEEKPRGRARLAEGTDKPRSAVTERLSRFRSEK